VNNFKFTLSGQDQYINVPVEIKWDLSGRDDSIDEYESDIEGISAQTLKGNIETLKLIAYGILKGLGASWLPKDIERETDDYALMILRINDMVGVKTVIGIRDNVKTTIDILLDKYRDESVNGLSIPRDTILAVKISSNVAAAHLVPDLADDNFSLQVEFTSPEGVPFTIFGGQDFGKIMLDWTGQPIIIGGIDPSSEEAGQWSVQAKWLPDTVLCTSSGRY
jgi:hypothetical protein